MIKKLTFLLFTFTFAFLAQVNAQTAISPEKQAAIKEIVRLMDSNNQIEQLLQVFSAQMDSTREQTVRAILDERIDISPAEKRQLEASLLESSKAASKKLQERLSAKIDYRAIMDEMMIVVYDKFFTLEEIKDLLVFYNSPTGQKMIKIMPELAAESMQVTQNKLLPKMINALKEIEQEDRREIEAKLEAKKPRAKKPGTK
jgi:hypothetical protein